MGWTAPAFEDAGFLHAEGEITIGPELNGRRALFSWMVSGTVTGNNRLEIQTVLQLDGATVAEGDNYAARNNTQSRGGSGGEFVAVLATGQVWRVQALRDGTTSTLRPLGTRLRIETKS
ncbi:MAG: hypothetical protein AAF447_08470 [Myxococcota bacterium]